MWLFCFSGNGVYFSGTSHSQESLIAMQTMSRYTQIQ
jgi:hypothetical protein